MRALSWVYLSWTLVFAASRKIFINLPAGLPGNGCAIFRNLKKVAGDAWPRSVPQCSQVWWIAYFIGWAIVRHLIGAEIPERMVRAVAEHRTTELFECKKLSQSGMLPLPLLRLPLISCSRHRR